MEDAMKDRHDEQMSMLMSLSLDGLLSKEEQQRLETHLAGCPGCRAEWQAMQQVSAMFERSAMVGPPLGFAIRVERKLAEKNKKRRRLFGGVAVFTGSVSLAGITMAAVLFVIVAAVAWHWIGALPSVQQGTSAILQVASGMGLLGKGASLFLGDMLLRYGLILVVGLGIGLLVLAGLWLWLFVMGPGRSHRNGYV
jgi:predicted anti-sigma-YlaC factor YlaD